MIQTDSTLVNYVSENLSNINEAAGSVIPISDKITPLLWLLVANIVIVLIKFVFDIAVKNQDVNIHRKGLINEFILKTEKKLFYDIEKLSRFDGEQVEDLLIEILKIEKYSRVNRIFIRRPINNTTIKLLDYYKEVSSNYSKKDIRKEAKLMDEYSSKFYE